MTFITLNRPDVYIDKPIENGNIERRLIKQRPVTINPEYIVSMIERFDSDEKFESTELYLSNGVWYNVTSRIEEIVEMIKKEDKHDCCLWDFGRHECSAGLHDCPDNDTCYLFD